MGCIRYCIRYQATQEEANASISLFKKSSDEKVTLHFDINFNFNIRFNLRPLFFAYDDRANIIDLIIETLEQLAVAGRGLHVKI